MRRAASVCGTPRRSRGPGASRAATAEAFFAATLCRRSGLVGSARPADAANDAAVLASRSCFTISPSSTTTRRRLSSVNVATTENTEAHEWEGEALSPPAGKPDDDLVSDYRSAITPDCAQATVRSRN
jgi:hypothetical protein